MKKAIQEDSSTNAVSLKDSSAVYRTTHPELDLALLLDSLAKTPWERMQANDDAVNFAESLRTAMERRLAKSK
jgi:hypothetical protein